MPTCNISEDAVRTLIENTIGDNPNREGLLDTPRRYTSALLELTWSTALNDDQYLREICTTFDGEDYDEMIIVKNIPFVSLCEHHLLPFIGTAAIGYIPGTDNKILGLSKLARITKFYAGRPQVQERMTGQIANAILTLLPEVAGVGVRVKAMHSCMELRGVKAQNSETITSSLKGCFSNHDTRQEFLSLVA